MDLRRLSVVGKVTFYQLKTVTILVLDLFGWYSFTESFSGFPQLE